MSNTVEEAKAELVRAKGRLTRALETTPDDRINWSPSPTARTPIHQVVHSATSIGGIQGMLAGKPWEFGGPEDMDKATREEEKSYDSREQALAVLEKHSSVYLAWLDTLTPDQVASTLDTPFGSFPMAAAITFPADHMRGHAAQMEYIQTIYGDRDWHM